MMTKRTYEILKSIKNSQDIVISEAELGILEQKRFITVIQEGEDLADENGRPVRSRQE